MFWLSQTALRVVIPLSLVVIGLSLALGLLYSLDWSAITPRLVILAMLVTLLYWATTLIPGPIRKIGKAAGTTASRIIWNTAIRKRKGNSRK